MTPPRAGRSPRARSGDRRRLNAAMRQRRLDRGSFAPSAHSRKASAQARRPIARRPAQSTSTMTRCAVATRIGQHEVADASNACGRPCAASRESSATRPARRSARDLERSLRPAHASSHSAATRQLDLPRPERRRPHGAKPRPVGVQRPARRATACASTRAARRGRAIPPASLIAASALGLRGRLDRLGDEHRAAHPTQRKPARPPRNARPDSPRRRATSTGCRVALDGGSAGASGRTPARPSSAPPSRRSSDDVLVERVERVCAEAVALGKVRAQLLGLWHQSSASSAASSVTGSRQAKRSHT